MNPQNHSPAVIALISLGTYLAYIFFLSIHDAWGYFFASGFFIFYTAESLDIWLDRFLNTTQGPLKQYQHATLRKPFAVAAPIVLLAITWAVFQLV